MIYLRSQILNFSWDLGLLIGISYCESFYFLLTVLNPPYCCYICLLQLNSMFETKDKIFVVMEKMNGDMLEMILSQVCCLHYFIVNLNAKIDRNQWTKTFFRRRAVWMSTAQNFWSFKFWALFDICIPEGLPTAIWSQVCVKLGLREFSRGLDFGFKRANESQLKEPFIRAKCKLNWTKFFKKDWPIF